MGFLICAWVVKVLPSCAAFTLAGHLEPIVLGVKVYQSGEGAVRGLMFKGPAHWPGL